MKAVLFLVVLGLCVLGCVSLALYLLNLHSTIANIVGGLVMFLGIAGVAAAAPFGVRTLKGSATSWWGKFMLLVAFSLFIGCTTIAPGHVGIVVNKMGSDRGVESYPQQTGLVWFNPFVTTVFEYPTFVQTVVWTRTPSEGNPNNEEVSFNTKEGLTMTADVSVSYQLTPENVPSFYVKFRNDDLKLFTHGYLRSLARDKFNEVAATYGVEEIYGPKKEVFLGEVKRRINEALKPLGAHIDEQFGFVGAPRPPENVVQAINAKIASTQKAIQLENELRQAQAEAAKQVASAEGGAKAKLAAAQGDALAAVALAEGEATATVARATAAYKANDLVSKSVTPAVLEWKRLEIQQAPIQKWNGVRPTVEAGTGTNLLLAVPPVK